MMEEISQLASLSPTRLPTAHIVGCGKDEFSEIPIMRWSDISTLPQQSVSNEQQLIRAWATLLRSYSLSDLVTFEVLRDHDLSSAHREASKPESESQIAVCQWGGLTDISQSDVKKYNPLVTVLRNAGISAITSLINTGVMFGIGKAAIQDHLDFVVMAIDQDNANDIRLRIRSSKVPEKFGRAVGATFRHIISRPVDEEGYQVQESVLSGEDRICLRNFTQSPVSNHQKCMHHLVKNRVIQNPTAEAVCAWDGTITYAELDAYSEVIAKILVANGVRVGQYVPFAFEKSLWSIVAVLAILKAGAAFVPIDPGQPLARLRGILEDVNAKTVLVSQSYRLKFEQLVQTTLVVSAETATLSAYYSRPNNVELPVTSPHDTAFVLFTSGSTGKPKGMIMQHGAYSTHTICHGRAMGYEQARVLQFAAHTFDVYVMDVFATLAFGGCICIPSEDDRRFNIVKVFNEFQIDLAILTPSFAHVLEPSQIPNLRTLAVGGEALKKETVQKWTRDARNVSLIQIYGPAEVGICILGNLSQASPSPEVIGYPLDNSLCLLIDPDDVERLVPVGAVGELVVAGPTMLREYLNNPEKTKASFIDSPKWATDLALPHHRFYRSGDLLRYNIQRMDGSFDFVGRKDSQVKYHGQRMELEDIEHHLSSIKSISACMASLPKEGCLKGKLVAVVQLESSDQSRVKHGAPLTLVSNPELNLGKMREHLSERLPGYMVPNALLVVRNVPFTPSLKLDRPRINDWIAALDSELVTDGLIRKLCCDVLTADERTAHTLSLEYARLIGGDDKRRRAAFEGHNFCLQAGGIDSIQVISLSNFVQKAWSVRVPMALMLSSCVTIRDIAAVIDKGEPCNGDLKQSSFVSVESEADALTDELVAAIERPTIQAVVKNVLLTGATGFLGLEILHTLLQKGMTVFALVRDRSEAMARQRLVDKAKAAGWWKESFSSKLEVWLGNLAESNLGLNDIHLQRIAGNCAPTDCIHTIIHNGAKVHYAFDYSSLRETNVRSTVELLTLTARASTSLRSFVYVSGGQQLSFAEEQEALDVPNEYGYIRSKLVSEAVVGKCMRVPQFRRTTLSIVKPGYIIGNPRTGEANLTDFLWRLIASCVEVGGYDADDADRWLFVADQSRIASLIVDNALCKHPQPVYKVLDGLRFTDLWQILTNEFWYNLQPLPHSEWVHRIQEKVSEKQDTHVMFPLMHMLEKGEPIGTLGGPPAPSSGVKDAIRANVRFLTKVGYLPKAGEHLGDGNVTPDAEAENLEVIQYY